MRKILCAASLLSMLLLASTSSHARDDDAPKARFKGKFAGKAFDKIFEKMDADGDGKVSKEEFKKFFSTIGQGKLEGKGQIILDKLFDKLDTNGDGFLSKEELKKLGGLRQKLGGKLGEKLKEKLKDRFGKNKKDDKDD